jgi:hypothetical protein
MGTGDSETFVVRNAEKWEGLFVRGAMSLYLKRDCIARETFIRHCVGKDIIALVR